MTETPEATPEATPEVAATEAVDEVTQTVSTATVSIRKQFMEDAHGLVNQVRGAADAVEAELVRLKGSVEESEEYTRLMQLFQDLGSAARWFAHPRSPVGGPSPSLDPNNPAASTGRTPAAGEAVQTGVI
jgi:hypothetical protein